MAGARTDALASRFDVILIGGAPGSGKSTLGRALAAALGHGSTSGDDLAIAMRSVTGPEDHPELHPARGAGHVAYFTNSPPDKLIEDAERLEHAMWPVLERVSMVHLQKRAGVVIDWWLLPPDSVSAMASDRIASLWLHVDPDVLWERERRNTSFFGDSPDPGRMLDNFMARSIWRNDLVEEQATRLELPLLRVSGQTVRQLQGEALDILT